MLKTRRILQTLDFVRQTFDGSEWFRAEPAQRAYRWEHTLRVAGICGQIARAEKLDEEGLTIAGLLHDIAYGLNWPENYDWREHGRDGARCARAFLGELELPRQTVEEICYGIAIHVDDRADFPGERTAFAQTVGDADNIDRFDVFRIYDTLRQKDFFHMELDGRLSWLRGLLPQLERLECMEVGTRTAAGLWRKKLEYQREFYGRLLEQLEGGLTPEKAEGNL